jgi:hypothetical protein
MLWQREGMECIETVLSEGQLCYIFDLNQPIRPQIIKAKNDLHSEQTFRHQGKLGRRQRRDPWPTYLRVLDARDAKLTFLDIGQIVLNFQGNYSEIGSAAKKIHKLAYSLGLNFPN